VLILYRAQKFALLRHLTPAGVSRIFMKIEKRFYTLHRRKIDRMLAAFLLVISVFLELKMKKRARKVMVMVMRMMMILQHRYQLREMLNVRKQRKEEVHQRRRERIKKHNRIRIF
jgi:hypothetical protein